MERDKRVKKPPVKPETRLDWLKRTELGETPPQIAQTDSFDVRTVRKHIELGRLERDVRQARSEVLRHALEDHYRDLLDTVRDIEKQVSSGSPVSSEKDIPLMYGLHQHMPRSRLWGNLRKWNRTLQELAELESTSRIKIQKEIEVDGRLKGIVSQGGSGVISAAVDVLVHQVKQWARGSEGLILDRNFRLEMASEGRVRVIYGFSHFGEIEESQVGIIKNVINDFELKMKHWTEYMEMEKLFNRLSRLGQVIRELLTVILLRRIVQGKCKYCPL
jgi:hypothetical protein